ncbi:MAG: DEAD/DEAH box helicase [Acidimicrobiales bacterium]|nr:DEAD/DEAH box helicase [Acidimicrobiales bacterium]
MVATDPYWLADGGGLDAAEALLREMGEEDGRLVHLERLAAREATFSTLQRPLPARVAERLGVDRLWSHQAAAIDLLRDGRSVVVATGTGSGKSLCYQAAIAEAVSSPVRAGTSLLLFPTKALAQDQLRSLQAMKLPRLAAATYDGDAGQAERAWVRRSGNVVLTNPEMLHHGILPHHDRWARFLARLRYVVVDELHVLRGIFGSHVAQLLRRLRRLCAHYGSSPTFAFTSATLGDADRLASSLCGLDVVAVTNDGSPQGERLFALWNPPVIDERGTRASANSEAAAVAAALVRTDRRTIVFCRSRKGTELVAADIKRRLPAQLAPLVRPYRSGYLAEERRDIELALFTGHLRGVVATSALELGIDVSGLDACVLTGVPGTMASMWQQAGRAGRASADGVTVLVAGDDQLDQWLMRHPQEVFRRAPEPAVINPSNPYVLDPHLECAAFERPLSALDGRFWPEDLDEGVVRLARRDRLGVRRRDRGAALAAWTGRGWPSHGIGLRSASSAEVKIVRVDDEQQLVGTVDVSRAPATVHPGAVYLHQGVTYRVTELDLEARTAWVEQAEGDEYTTPRSDVSFRILECVAGRPVGRARLSIGRIEVVSQVTGYQRIDLRTRTTLGTEPLELPPSVLETRAVWYTIDEDLLDGAGLRADQVPGALHALEHTAIGILPLFTICDRWDVGGVSTALHPDTGCPTVTIYDGYPGGAGIAELAFEAADRHLAETLEVLQRCACADGCPSCVVSPKCGNGNEPLDKDGARRLLETLLAAAPFAPTEITLP